MRRGYHEQLDDLSTEMIRLSALATEAVAKGTQVLLDADLPAAEEIIADDARIDDVAHDVEERCYQLLALQQPMASDLRKIVAVLRNLHELERIGDLMVNVAKGARRIYPHELTPKIRGLLERMGQQAASQIRLATDAFVDSDVRRAAALNDMDDVMDDLQKDLFRSIFAAGAPSEEEVHRAVQIALIGRYYERIADHAVNIAERVVFMVTGEIPGVEADQGAVPSPS